MIRYILELNNQFYLKEDNIEGRIIYMPSYDREGLKNEILAKGYKSIQGARYGAKKLLQANPKQNIIIRALVF